MMGLEVLQGILLVVTIVMDVYAIFVLRKLHILLKEAERFLEELENEK